MKYFLTALMSASLIILGHTPAEAARGKARAAKAKTTVAASQKPTAEKSMKKSKKKARAKIGVEQARYEAVNAEDLRLSDSRVPVIIDPFDSDRTPAMSADEVDVDEVIVSMKLKKAPKTVSKKKKSRRGR